MKLPKFPLPNGLLRAALDWLYPQGCACCGQFHSLAPLSHLSLCAACEKGLWPVRHRGCQICGSHFPGAAHAELTCEACRESRPAYDFAASAYVYRGRLRELIHRFKYGKQRPLRRPLGALLEEALEDSRMPPREDCLAAPVPLHARRRRERGFNQAEALCEVLRQRAGIPWRPLLKRTRYTTAQVGLNREERRRNLKGAFEATRSAKKLAAPPAILLVDDVLTTGSTARECSAVLRGLWPEAKIIVVTVARGE